MFRTAKKALTQTQQKQAAFLRQFGRDEAGSMVFMTLTFFVMMLILGGMAVDFMRFESRRTMLQNTADVAVLAAAELDQDKDAKAVVIDYFEKAGFAGSIDGEPDIIDIDGYKSVGVKANFDMNTFFLKFAGIPQLTAPAQATAIEGVANIEISMALDISGSMADPVTPLDGSASTESKIQALRTAAKLFARTVLVPEYDGKISLTLVPYSENVNAGPLIFNQLNTTNLHSYSHCIDFDGTDFNSTAISTSKTYRQAQHFQWNSAVSGGYYVNETTDTVCPRYSYERITPLSRNLSEIESRIDNLQPRAGTAIYAGMKWATILLDPSARPIVTSLVGSSDIDPVFSGRPANYSIEGKASATQKVIVLMTDGQNSKSSALHDQYYDTISERDYWAANNFWYAWSYAKNSYGNWLFPNSAASYYYDLITAENADTYLDQMCDLAKDKGIIVFAVAVEAQAHGQQEMAKCASSPAHYFGVQGDELATVFQAIAKQITELRLSL